MCLYTVVSLSIRQLFLDFSLKMQRVSLLGRIANISVLREKERIHDGKTWKSLWRCLHHRGRQVAR
jgi:hypothetical protein